jgi:hypothetical protein
VSNLTFCDISDIRYVEMQDRPYQVWLVDYDGAPIMHHMTVDYYDPDYEPSQWPSWERYRCIGCMKWFTEWEDVQEHLWY